MSREHFSDVLSATEPVVSVIDICGLPPEEGYPALCQNPTDLVLGEKLGVGERPNVVAPETEQAAAFRELAYGELMKTTEGTPEYYQALEAFIVLLFPDSSSPTTLPTEAQRPEAPPGHDVQSL